MTRRNDETTDETGHGDKSSNRSPIGERCENTQEKHIWNQDKHNETPSEMRDETQDETSNDSEQTGDTRGNSSKQAAKGMSHATETRQRNEHGDKSQ